MKVGGLQPTEMGQVAQRIAAEQGITLSQAYKKARKEYQQPPAPDGWSRKDYILEALRRANSNPGIGSDRLLELLKEMRQPSNINDLTSDLWALQKNQYVMFHESHTNHGSVLSRVRLTLTGRSRAVARLANGQGDPKRSSRPEVIAKPAEPEIVPATEYAPPVTPPLGDPLPQNMRQATDTPPGYLDGLAAIQDLVERKAAKEVARGKAARVVEAASMISDIEPAEADRLMSIAADIEGPAFTKLERDVLRLLEKIDEAERGRVSRTH